MFLILISSGVLLLTLGFGVTVDVRTQKDECLIWFHHVGGPTHGLLLAGQNVRLSSASLGADGEDLCFFTQVVRLFHVVVC